MYKRQTQSTNNGCNNEQKSYWHADSLCSQLQDNTRDYIRFILESKSKGLGSKDITKAFNQAIRAHNSDTSNQLCWFPVPLTPDQQKAFDESCCNAISEITKTYEKDFDTKELEDIIQTIQNHDGALLRISFHLQCGKFTTHLTNELNNQVNNKAQINSSTTQKGRLQNLRLSTPKALTSDTI